MTTNSKNRLAGESSPYLLQHADNPVDWYPWGEEALQAARAGNKPILLSIGYSACHWCHVMAHESFEDDATAAVMNAQFINIKVDREERPDIDRIYQTAHQIITQRGGGWPLTMFLEPDEQRPFFGGTYFPPEPRHGMPSFRDLLERVAEHFRDDRASLSKQANEIVDVLGQLDPQRLDDSETLGPSPLAGARDAIGKLADREHGGIGNAPKFPQPAILNRLLRHWRASANGAEPDVEALFVVSLSATRMAEGGLVDQLAGGFFRYSVDRYWQIPHFEKMLYDNGPLLALYAELHLATGEPFFARVARDTASYLLGDLRSPEGGFYASRDADSGGREGGYYLWTPEQVRERLAQDDGGEDDYDLLAAHMGLDEEANFEGEWHLTLRRPLPDLARELGEDADELQTAVDRSREMLLSARAERPPPGRDEKCLTAWNALAIRGLAVAGRALDDHAMIDAAAKAVTFLQEHLQVDDTLMAVYADGRARYPAYLDDHAFLLDALLELLQARWNSAWLAQAIELADALLARFEDDAGGFFFTAHDGEALMSRPKPLADEAMPSGNGVAALALQRLGFLLGESRYLAAAERTLRVAWRAMEEYPHGHATLISALEEYLEHPEIVVLRGPTEEIQTWQRSAAQLYAPRRLVFAIPADAQHLPGALADRRAAENGTVAYRCVGTHCSMPLTSFEALASEWRQAEAR